MNPLAQLRSSRRLVVICVAAVISVGVLAVLAMNVLFTSEPVTPAVAALDVCSGSPIVMDPLRQSVGTWTGSSTASEAAVRCRWPKVTAAALKERMGDLGYGDINVQEGVTNYLGNDQAWVVSADATGSRPAVSASSARGSKDLDVSVGGFIHTHDDNSVHIHDADGNEPGN
jgi:hypothetical protein